MKMALSGLKIYDFPLKISEGKAEAEKRFFTHFVCLRLVAVSWRNQSSCPIIPTWGFFSFLVKTLKVPFDILFSLDYFCLGWHIFMA